MEGGSVSGGPSVLGVTETAVDLVAGGRSPLVVMRGTTLVAGLVHDACDPVPVHFPSTAVLVHSESTLLPAIASAGGRGPSRRKQ